LVLSSKNHTNPPIYVSLNGRFIHVVPNFRYLGVVFNRKLADMFQEKEIFAIHCGGIMGGTSGGDVDFIQGSNSANFGVWVHCL
jgi:hypothetical protein